jgi:threonine/homoserine/homoserine lactone efflux protein
MTLMAFLEGFMIGLGTIIFIGPVLFTLIQITLQRGSTAGLNVAFGIITSDILIVVLCYVGLVDYFQNALVQFWMAVIGSIILFSLGLKYMLKPYSPAIDSSTSTTRKKSNAFAKGFLVNFVNPFVFLVWISFLSLSKKKYASENNVEIFLFAVLTGIFTTDVIKVFLANKINSILKPAFLQKAFFIIGLILIGFGFRLVYSIASQ